MKKNVVDVALTDDERFLLRSGLAEWGGPATPTDLLARAMGFRDVADLHAEKDRLIQALERHEPLSPRDWVRILLATEIVFVSNIVGSGLDWISTTGLKDEVSIALLRSIQRKIPTTGSPTST